MNQKRAHEENTSSIECTNTDRLNNSIENKRRKYDDITTNKSENDWITNGTKK